MTQDKHKWLSVVGIEERGIGALSDEARALISAAALVVGGRRHLDLAASIITGKTLPWPSPPHDAIPEILAMRPNLVCVLSTGDPLYYGIATVLLRHVPIEQMRVLSALPIISLVAARLGWTLQETTIVALNGRPLERVIPALQPSARIIALSADETTPGKLAGLLKKRGFGSSTMTVLERLDNPNERLRQCRTDAFAWQDIARLNCVALEIPDDADAKAHSLPLSSGIDDERFEHDGQLTKREVRAVTLSALAPRRGELLWDIGLGAGSIAIEWLLSDPLNRAIGIEKDATRTARAAGNASRLGVPHLQIIQAEAPMALQDLPPPDAIFIGGGATAPGMLEAAWTALKPGGRLVINAISLETEKLLLDAVQTYGGELTRIGIERTEAIGSMTGWRPAMRVMQWKVTKP